MGGGTFNGPAGCQSGDGNEQHNHFHAAPTAPVAWPIRVGTVPPLASAYQQRPQLRVRINQARAGSGTVVLAQVLAGGGGMGKSQPAASYAHQALSEGTDLVVWAAAAEITQIIALYARAAALTQSPGAAGQDAEADADAFLAWLTTTQRSWLVVLDDVADPQGMGRWWPPTSAGGRGRVLVTTRRRDAVLSGGGRVVVPIDTYTSLEADAYLRERLTRVGCEQLLDGVQGAVTEALGRLPLALAHAAAYMINEDTPCTQYLDLLHHQDTHLDALLPKEADTEGYGRQVTAALLLSLDAAQTAEPATLPALRLAAFLDPAGHPRALWETEAVQNYLGSDQGRKVVRVLYRYGLLTDHAAAGPRAISVHALTARAARESAPRASKASICTVAADALLDIWPNPDHADPVLAAALRANTTSLVTHADEYLWNPDGHLVLYRAGSSLLGGGLYAAAVTYWELLTQHAERALGAEHFDTLRARCSLASSYRQAGRTDDAITLQEQLAVDIKCSIGSHHAETLTVRANLATSYYEAGRTEEAIVLQEQVTADIERIFGHRHPDVLIARGNLALFYQEAGRIEDAIVLQEQVTAEIERIFGAEHPRVLRALGNLALSYYGAGRIGDAMTFQERVAADLVRVLGPEHPRTLIACANLAASYRQAGRIYDAITLLRRVAVDSERVLGPEHPDTVAAVTFLLKWMQSGED